MSQRKEQWKQIIGSVVIFLFDSRHVNTKECIIENVHSIGRFNLTNNDKEKSSDDIVNNIP